MQEIRDVIETLQEKEKKAVASEQNEAQVAEFLAALTVEDRKQMRRARKRQKNKDAKRYREMHLSKTAPLSRRQSIKARKLLQRLEKKTGLLQIQEPKK